jgi:hypothetical protein
MNEPLAGTLVLELADVVSDLTCRQRELLRSLERFRVDLLGPETSLAAYRPPPPRFLTPPPPPPVAAPRVPCAPHPTHASPPPPAPPVAPPVPVAPPPPGQLAVPLVESASVSPTIFLPVATPAPARQQAWGGDERSPALRQTKRDYDYFTELDDLLARLPDESRPREGLFGDD